MEQIRADIALKRVQTPWEPWKAMATAFGAVASAMLALAVYVVSRLH